MILKHLDFETLHFEHLKSASLLIILGIEKKLLFNLFL